MKEDEIRRLLSESQQQHERYEESLRNFHVQRALMNQFLLDFMRTEPGELAARMREQLGDEEPWPTKQQVNQVIESLERLHE